MVANNEVIMKKKIHLNPITQPWTELSGFTILKHKALEIHKVY